MKDILKYLAVLAAVALAVSTMAIAQTAPPPAKAVVSQQTSVSSGAAEPWSEEWFKSIKEPVPWFKWGADLRLRDEYTNNLKKYTNADTGAAGLTLNKDFPYRDTNYGRYRTRLWTTVTPIQDIDINARLVWEFRSYCEPKVRATSYCSDDIVDMRDVNFDEAIFDNLNVKWKNVLGQPLTLTVGRQDIIFGDGWLVLDGTPLDGSRTIFFDAIRGTYELKDIQTTIDAVYLQDYAVADKWIEPFNNQDHAIMEQNERGVILYVTNKSLDKTEISPYFIYKQDRDAHLPNDPLYAPADIYTGGLRVAKEFDEHWRARAEIADQLGHKNYHDICALGFNSRLSYFVKDALNNNFRLAYEFLSGDDPSTDTNEQFDPLWGRWPQFSEALALLGFDGRPGETTNMHRIGPGWSINPTNKMEIATDYHLLFCDENTKAGTAGYSDSGCFRGQLLTLLLQYTFNPHMKGHLLSEFFFPGDYYSDLKNDVGTFLRAEMVFTW